MVGASEGDACESGEELKERAKVKIDCPTWLHNQISLYFSLFRTKSFLALSKRKMDASRACLSSAASSSGRGCFQHAAAAPNGRSPASWRRCNERRRASLVVVVAAGSSSPFLPLLLPLQTPWSPSRFCPTGRTRRGPADCPRS